MSNRYGVVQSRVEDDGSSTHLISGPGGIIEVDENNTGNFSARLRSGYVLRDESEEEELQQAISTIRMQGEGKELV